MSRKVTVTFFCFLLKFYLLFCDTERPTERQTEHSHLWLSMLARTGSSLKPGARSIIPRRWQRPSYFSHHHCLTEPALARSWSQEKVWIEPRHASLGCKCPNHQAKCPCLFSCLFKIYLLDLAQ